jgi:hypothetical protein
MLTAGEIFSTETPNQQSQSTFTWTVNASGLQTQSNSFLWTVTSIPYSSAVNEPSTSTETPSNDPHFRSDMDVFDYIVKQFQ